MARLAEEGKDVHYAAFSLCRRSLPAGLAPDTLANECKAAMGVLGVPAQQVSLFDFEVRDFPAQRQPVLEELVKLGQAINPDLVFMPSATDMHQDHGVIHAEARRAFRRCSLLGYELPWNQTTITSQLFMAVTPAQLEQKAKALQCYRSQQHRAYMEESFVRSLAQVRGIQGGMPLAEAFEIYKILQP